MRKWLGIGLATMLLTMTLGIIMSLPRDGSARA
jgi:hypothetical protein